MPELSFQIEEAVVVPHAAVPTLAFRLRIRNAAEDEEIHTVALRCQIQIEAARRRYTAEEQARLRDLFDTPDRWSQTLRSLLWMNTSMVVPAFAGAGTTAELQVPCTFDFNVAATKYFEGLECGEIPLNMMFSGTVFYAQERGDLQVAPISWAEEARFRLPVTVWRAMMDAYYPNSVWLNLRRDVFERLCEYKRQRGIPTWEQALEEMLAADEAVRS
ncbi:MAG: DUF6084 family protein [Acidobacteriaceae bacterium]